MQEVVRHIRTEELGGTRGIPRPAARTARRLWAALLALWLGGFSTVIKANSTHADTPGIDWFDGGVAEAFDAAKSAHKPVFLYWGAKWCPPCQQLKSSVFSRGDFIAKSREFVAVYLDGDDPGAQKWGEKFKVSGYPTVVILRSDQREITRIAGGIDLAAYAYLLDGALADLRPMDEVVALLRGEGALSRADCQRLGSYPWEPRDYSDSERLALARGLAHASGACTRPDAGAGSNPAEGARLSIASAEFAPAEATTSAVIAIVEDSSLARSVADDLEGLDADFFKRVAARGPAPRTRFLQAYGEVMEAVAADPSVIDAEQLAALGARLAAIKALAPDGKVPQDLAAHARERVIAALAKRSDSYVRSGVVNSASFVYDQLDDANAEYAVLQAEVATSKTPYYYMSDLGDVEEKRGHMEASLAWYERAYRESQGVATRFQWGVAYVSALLRQAPTEHQRIRDTALAVLAELDGPDRIQARSRFGLEKLDERLKKWNSSHRYDADVQALHARMSATCGKLPAGDSGLKSCRKFLA